MNRTAYADRARQHKRGPTLGAITAGGSRLPMSDMIRMGSHAVHHLSIVDGRVEWHPPPILDRDQARIKPNPPVANCGPRP